jgi:hypothetical protein
MSDGALMRWLVVALVACTASTDPIEPQVTTGVEQHAIPIYLNKQLDVLMVIDNTPAMAPYADVLRANLRRFADDIRDTELHLGVVTADPADLGAWHTAGIVDGFLDDAIGPDGARARNYAGDLGDALVALGDVGTQGARSSPLAAAAMVYGRGGFSRGEIDAIVIITANDLPDESTELYEALFGAPLGPHFLVVHGPGERLPAFLDRFHRTLRAPITDDDWSAALHVPRLIPAFGRPCIEGSLFDSDTVAPGVQGICAAWYDFPAGGPVVPSCSDAPDRECWRLRRDPAKCPVNDQLIFDIDHERGDFPEGAMLHFECLTTTTQI